MSGGGVLIVSNRLPVNIVEQVGGGVTSERSVGGVATAMDVVAKRLNARWVGWTGFKRVLTPDELAAARLPKRYIPVQAGKKTLRRYYDRFSNGYLWPVLHGMRPVVRPNESDWQSYQAMNRRFADIVRKHIRPGDVIWIHDYHLMLVPQYLREAGVPNAIGYFLHVPFPRPTYWLRRPYGRQLAHGIAAADVIGMQRIRDARNFEDYTAAAGIGVAGHLDCFPIGVDYEAYRQAAQRPLVRRLQRKIKDSVAGKKVIFSLSRMDYTKGILVQLKAARRFLSHHKTKQGVVYKLVVAPSREHLPEYTRLSRAVEAEAKRINESLGHETWQPVDYEHRTIGFDETAAWYGLADVLLLLPCADGMNLVAKEYVAARQDDDGMIVLSTATGASDQLADALLVPPDNVEAAALAIAEAVNMPRHERPKRWRGLRATVRDEDIFWWAENFLQRLGRSDRTPRL